MKQSANLLILLGAGVILTSCNGDKVATVDPAATGEAEAPEVVETTTEGKYLYSGYEPLEIWMDERYKIRYENMPLKMVFDQEPISGIRYHYVNLPEDKRLFELVSSSINRREVLKEVADFYGLSMELKMVDGRPSYVMVRGNGTAAPAVSSPAPAVTPSSVTPDPVPSQVPATAPVSPPAPDPTPEPAPAPAPEPAMTETPTVPLNAVPDVAAPPPAPTPDPVPAPEEVNMENPVPVPPPVPAEDTSEL